jgi:hypothetical protein
MTRRGWPVDALNPRYRIIGGNVIIGAAGAIASQDGAKKAGGTVTQTASEDGRYTIAFDRTYGRVVTTWATMFGPDDAAFPTTTGSSPKCRNRATTGFDVQFVREDTQADADPASGTEIDWGAIVELR